MTKATKQLHMLADKKINLIDFDIKLKKFLLKNTSSTQKLILTAGEAVYGLAMLNKLKLAATVDWFALSVRVITATIYPYYGVINEFCDLYNQHKINKDLDTAVLLRRAKYIQDTICCVVLPEQLIVQLAEAYSTLRHAEQDKQAGFVVLESIVGIDPNLLALFDFQYNKIKINHDFTDIIKSIKTCIAAIFTQRFVKFCLKHELNFADISMGVMIQKWQQPIKTYSDIKKIAEAPMAFASGDFLQNSRGQPIFFRAMRQQFSPLVKPDRIVNCFYGFKDKEFARIAVVGIVVFKDRVLMLKQKDDDKFWRPPCGGVHKGEDMHAALLREVYEDTKLKVNILLPVSIWKSTKKLDAAGLSVVYVCEASSADVVLSNEYTDWRWIDKQDLAKIKITTTFDLTNWSNYIDLGVLWKNKNIK